MAHKIKDKTHYIHTKSATGTVDPVTSRLIDSYLKPGQTRSELVRAAIDNELSESHPFSYPLDIPHHESIQDLYEQAVPIAVGIWFHLSKCKAITMEYLVTGRREVGVRYHAFRNEGVTMSDYEDKTLFLAGVSCAIEFGYVSVSEGLVSVAKPMDGVNSEHREVGL